VLVGVQGKITQSGGVKFQGIDKSRQGGFGKCHARAGPRLVPPLWVLYRTRITGAVMDGEATLYKRMSEYFKKASFSLDIRHLEEKLWEVGRTFEAKGSDELAQWVEPYRTMLYQGQASKLLEKMKAWLRTLSARAKRDENKREKLIELIQRIFQAEFYVFLF
jgi:hypothetical protein